MRKIFIVFNLLLSTVFTGHAQFFIEGYLGVVSSNSISDKSEGFEKSNDNDYFRFSVSPKIGYWLNDRMAVGINVIYASQPIELDRINNWGGSIFSRYKLLGFKKCSILAEGSMGIYGSSRKEKSESLTKKIVSPTSFGINLCPLISYDLTEKFSIISVCDFIGFDFYSGSYKVNGSNRKQKFNLFRFNAESNLFNSLSNIKVGFSYKF